MGDPMGDPTTGTDPLPEAFGALMDAVGYGAVRLTRPIQDEWKTNATRRVEQLEAHVAEIRHAPGMPGYLEAAASFSAQCKD